MQWRELPIPPHFDPERVGAVWRVEYEKRASEAAQWAKQHALTPAATDERRVALVAVDVQNTFCLPDFELFVGGRSGTGAIDDNRRLCEFIYRNLGSLTEIIPTLDTHQAMQIFHAIFFIDEAGNHPEPYTLITTEDVRTGKWRFNPALSDFLDMDAQQGQKYIEHYVTHLEEGGRYALTIWPYHAMLGGIGHALVSAVEEAIFFHTIARYSQPGFQIKGNHPLTENYSVLRAEILTDAEGREIAARNQALVEKLRTFDAIVIAGQAKSHCVAWTIEDLRRELAAVDPKLLGKIYLLEDCTSPVVVPGVVDYTDDADAAFREFEASGMHVVRSTEPMQSWPGMG